jgi:hypothetical protein
MLKCVAYVMYWDLSEGKHQLLMPHDIPGGEHIGVHTRGPIKLTYGETSQEKHALETVSPWIGR